MKRKVVIVIPCLLTGGTEVQTMYLARALSAKYEVTVIVLFEHDDTMASRFRSEGIRLTLLSGSDIRPAGIVRKLVFMFRKLVPAVKKENPFAVHTQYMDPGALPIIALRLAGFRNIVTTLHVPGHIYRNKWVPVMISAWFTKIFLTVSRSSEQSLFGVPGVFFDAALYQKGRKHFTLYNCVDTEETGQIRNALQKKASPASPGIVCIARLSIEKGVDILIEAFPMIVKNIEAATLTIVGDGPVRDRLEERCRELGISGSVRWAGKLPRAEALKILADADIAVVPSRFEGFGLTAIEAMALGVPVVASNTDGLAEIIRHRETGFLFKTGDSPALADAVATLWSEPGLHDRLAVNALEPVNSIFSMEQFSDSILSVYNSIHGPLFH